MKEGEKGETTDPSFFQAKQNQDVGDYDHFSDWFFGLCVKGRKKNISVNDFYLFFLFFIG